MHPAYQLPETLPPLLEDRWSTIEPEYKDVSEFIRSVDSVLISALFCGSGGDRRGKLANFAQTPIDDTNVEHLAHEMFFADLQSIRASVQKNLLKAFRNSFEIEKKFHLERAFFTEKLQTHQGQIDALMDTIRELNGVLEREKSLDQEIFVDEYVG